MTARDKLAKQEVVMDEREDLQDLSCSICLGPFEDRTFLKQCFHILFNKKTSLQSFYRHRKQQQLSLTHHTSSAPNISRWSVTSTKKDFETSVLSCLDFFSKMVILYIVIEIKRKI